MLHRFFMIADSLQLESQVAPRVNLIHMSTSKGFLRNSAQADTILLLHHVFPERRRKMLIHTTKSAWKDANFLKLFASSPARVEISLPRLCACPGVQEFLQCFPGFREHQGGQNHTTVIATPTILCLVIRPH